MKRGNIIIICLVLSLFSALIFIFGCSERPQSTIPPALPTFEKFSITVPPGVENHYGVQQAVIHVNLAHLLFDYVNTIVASAEGPTRVGLSFVWVSDVNEATYTIDGGIGVDGYDWVISINGTDEFGYYYDNEEAMDGSSNFAQDRYFFNIYDPEKSGKQLGIVSDYSTAGGAIRSLGMLYGHISMEVHSKIDIEQNSNGTGHILCWWDTNHIWPDSSKYLELYYWDGASGTAESGSWQTWDRPELSIVASSGAW
jgi:hypothetical protein